MFLSVGLLLVFDSSAFGNDVNSSSGLFNLLLDLNDGTFPLNKGLIAFEVEFGVTTSVITTVEARLSEIGEIVVVRDLNLNRAFGLRVAKNLCLSSTI